MSWPPPGFKSRPSNRFPCPYRLCSGIVYLRYEPPPPWEQGKPSHWLVPVHDISNALLKGTCPASLMRLPFFRRDEWPTDTTRALEEAYQRDAHRIPGLIGQADRERERSLFWRTQTRPDSFSARGPHRMGREPDNDQIDEWQIGGREDEDSGKQRQAINPPGMPPGVHGQEVGHHVASIGELIAAIHEAAMKVGEAIAAIQEQQNNLDQIRGSLQESQNMVAGVQGQHNSQLLQDYLSLIQQESNNVEQLNVLMEGMKGSLQVGQEKGEEFIGRLLG